MTAETDLLPLPEWASCDEIVRDMSTSEFREAMRDYARANMETLRAEVERLKRHAERQHAAYWRANRRAERLAEALRTIACMSEYFGKELSDARRLAEKAVAALAQEDRND